MTRQRRWQWTKTPKLLEVRLDGSRKQNRQVSSCRLTTTKNQKEEKAVVAVVDLIQGWITPFAKKQDLNCISTAKATPKDISSDLMKARISGERSYATFKEERLEKGPPATKFHDTMKTNRLNTFSSLYNKKEVKSKGRAISWKQISLCWSHHSNGTSVQSPDGRYLLSPWSITLGSVNTGRITQKDQQRLLSHSVAKKCDHSRETTRNLCFRCCWNGLSPKSKGDQATFGDIATTVLSMALNEASESNRIDLYLKRIMNTPSSTTKDY